MKGSLSGATGVGARRNHPAHDDEVGGGFKGSVTHVIIFSASIRTHDGVTKIAPNDNIWKSVTVNETTTRDVPARDRSEARSRMTRVSRRPASLSASSGASRIY
jgi:hypothetical protein